VAVVTGAVLVVTPVVIGPGAEVVVPEEIGPGAVVEVGLLVELVAEE